MTNHPGAGSYLDRHGKRRWRFRRGKKTIPLPHAPGHPEFEAAYMAAVEGREHKSATVHFLPISASPRSLKACWVLLKTEDPKWHELGAASTVVQTRSIERLLLTPVVEGEALLLGEVDIVDLKRRHIKTLIARKSATPHAAADVLRMLRKLIGVALDQEWLETDPTYRLGYHPEYKGWKAWPDEMLDKYEARWPIDSTPRLVYALALYFGHRRADITRVRPTDFKADVHNVVQHKTLKALELPIHPNLREVLAAVPDLDKRNFVVMTKWGKQFSPKALGMRMQRWTEAAGIPPGYTLHGLRKTLGKQLAQHGATTRQLMDVLGHDNIQHAALYSKEAEQKLMAVAAMEKLINWRRPK
jgi:site-specific recombinase XerC